MPSLHTPFAVVNLIRQPEQPNEPLQAFDAADEYLLSHLQQFGLIEQASRVLILNDAFGALTVSLADHACVTSSSDSFLAMQAFRKNMAGNARTTETVTLLAATEVATGPFDRVLLRVPKTLALLEDQLIRLQGQLAPGAHVIAAAMIKHLPRAAGELLEKYVGPVQASLGLKKARLLFCEPRESSVIGQPERAAFVSPYPSRYRVTEPAIELINHANVFCREGLDIGTRAFLPYLPQQLGEARVADLGCGNGILAIASALANPQAHYTLVDESFMAVQSAQENWHANLGQRPVTVRAADGLAGQPADSLDVVLCNPPFHQQQVVGDHLAWRMFQQARAALVTGGALYLVGNRHLGYHSKLAKLFRGVEQVAATPKFVILKARK